MQRIPFRRRPIRLTEVYGSVLKAITANPKILDTMGEELLRDLRESKKSDELILNWDTYSEADKREHRREKEATVFLCDRLRKGELLAFIRDPETGETLQLNSRDWQPTIRTLSKPLRIPVGLTDHINFERGASKPNIVIRGAYRPVFLWKEKFEHWLRNTFGQKKHPGGRPTGSGAWRIADQKLIMRMHRLLKSGSASSVNDAARQLAKEARGGGTETSRQSRLAKGYRKLFGSERN